MIISSLKLLSASPLISFSFLSYHLSPQLTIGQCYKPFTAVNYDLVKIPTYLKALHGSDAVAAVKNVSTFVSYSCKCL